MTIWLVRAGRDGNHEDMFREEKRIAIGFDFAKSLETINSQDDLRGLLQQRYPNASTQEIGSTVGQLWPFYSEMEKGELVVVPFKRTRTIGIAKITSGYQFFPNNPYHSRDLEWIGEEIYWADFDQETRRSLGSARTISRVRREDTITQIRNLAEGKPLEPVRLTESGEDDTGEGSSNIESDAIDAIERLIIETFKEHDMERLVEAILKAQGYSVYHSPKGKDKGIDLLAAPGPLGFGRPRICVQVKARREEKVDGPTLRNLLGAMGDTQSEQGLIVSWSGFTRDAESEKARQFFKVRFWDRTTLISEVLEHYDKLDSDIKAELPLKRIWIVIPKAEE